MYLVNIHTHHPTGAPELVELTNVRYGQDPAKKSSTVSAGLHPWYLADADLRQAEQWLREYANRPATLAIGEAGLDKAADTPWNRQLDAFALCVRIAAEFEKPLIIHCVKAYGEVLQILGRYPRNPFHVASHAIFHGFDKHAQTAKMLLDAGCHLSFGAALFRENSHAAEALRETPAHRLFLETDDKSLDIKAVYARAAEIRGVLADHLKAQICQNFQTVFGYNYS